MGVVTLAAQAIYIIMCTTVLTYPLVSVMVRKTKKVLEI